MCPSTEASPAQRSSDPLWGILVGTYVGLLVAPLVAFGAARLGVEDGGIRYGVSVVWLAVTVGLGWWVTNYRPGLAVRLGATRLRWLPAVVPIAAALVGYALGGFALLSRIPGISEPAFFGGLGAMIAGFILGVMARTRHTDAVLDSVDIACEFRAGWPDAARKRLRFAAGAFTLLTGACFVVGLFGNWFAFQLTGQLLLPMGIVVYSSTGKRSYTVSSAGLEQRAPAARALIGWNAFSGYSRTDDALVLHWPWRLDVRLALADLDDPDAVEGALTRYLDAQ